MSLAALQEGFLDALLHGGEPAQHVAPVDALEVYRRNVAANWHAALAAAYPVVHRLVGVDFFAGAARAYMERGCDASAAVGMGAFTAFRSRGSGSCRCKGRPRW